MSEDQPARTPEDGAPRRPGHRARAGGSARPVPRVPRGPRSPNRRPAPATRRHPEEQATRPLPRQGHDPGAASTGFGTATATPGRPEGSRPAAPGAVPPGPHRSGPRPRRRRSRIPRPVRLGAVLTALLLVAVLGWGAGLLLWADSRIDHVDALSGRADTPGTTYLIAGSDRRDGDAVADDGTQGVRTDTIMLLHKAPNGTEYLVSLPRDTLVEIPGHGRYKLNASYAFGGAPLLVETVEEFTGLTIDHYVEIGFDGVQNVVDAVGHVNLCIDQDVDDERSGLRMTEGCHDVGGEQALAFVRARYFDPTADLGRQQRQQQFVGALMDRVSSPGVLLNPVSQVRLAGAGSAALTTSEGTGIVDVGVMGLSARGAMADGAMPVLPIENPAFQTRHSGVAILTDEDDVAAFFGSIADGSAEVPAGG